MPFVYVQDSDGVWHIKHLHPMGLVRVDEKVQKHFPKGEHCSQCKSMQNVTMIGMRKATKGFPTP